MKLPLSPDDNRTLDLCCGGKKCPIIEDRGDTFVISDPDSDGSPIIVLSKEQAARTQEWLAARLAKA